MSSAKAKAKPGGGGGGGQARQKTLLQTWGYEGNVPAPSARQPAPSKSVPAPSARHHAPYKSVPAPSKASNLASKTTFNAANKEAETVFDDEEDALLNQAMEMSMTQYRLEQASRGECPPAATSTTSATAFEDLPGFDSEAGRTWIYPTNFPLRSYQFSIVKECLFQNTLVSLPTGLGKTFIAAVVMYNFFRWFPSSKMVFMAPTKPLVAQQIEACFNVMGIPQEETMEMTGDVNVKVRERAWQQKRVFFLTPQIMSNDLSRGLFPASEVRLLVVDEAHRAQGDYAYCQVVKELVRSRTQFRVMALSATPGKDIQAVRLMLQNLLISRIELRGEDSPDILPYTFARQIEKVVVPLGSELEAIRAKFQSLLALFVGRLAQQGALAHARRGNSADPAHHTKFGLLQARNEFRQNPPARLPRHLHGVVEGDFASAISLFHAHELLLAHGMRTFFNFLQKSVNGQGGGGEGGGQGGGGNGRLRHALSQQQVWGDIMGELTAKFADDRDNSRLNSSRPRVISQFSQGQEEGEEEERGIVPGHPKLERLRVLVLEHFERKKQELELEGLPATSSASTRVMIFSQYRDSVSEITACLHAHKPLIRVMEFVGQAGAKGKKGLTQKEQIEVVRRFREGGYNTLVATCVGEEGLDIGEVDLIVCYDVSKSPIRLVQRMGRTGRKRAGRIVVLVTEGKEEQTYNQSMYSKNSINKAILDGQKLSSFLTPSPRLIPAGLEPACLKMVMTVRNFVSAKSSKPNAIAPDKNRRISQMLIKKSREDRVDKSAKKKGIGKRKSSSSAAAAAFVPSDERAVEDVVVDVVVDHQQQQPVIGLTQSPERGDDLSDIELEVLQDIAKKLEEEEEEEEEEDRLPSWLFDGVEKRILDVKPAPSFDLELAFSDEAAIAAFDFVKVLGKAMGRVSKIAATDSIEEEEEEDCFAFDVSEFGQVVRKEEGMKSPAFTPQKSRLFCNLLPRETSTPKQVSRNLSRLSLCEVTPVQARAAAVGKEEEDEDCELLFDGSSFAEAAASLGNRESSSSSSRSQRPDAAAAAAAEEEVGRSQMELLFADSGFGNNASKNREYYNSTPLLGGNVGEPAAKGEMLYGPTQLLALMLSETSGEAGAQRGGRETGNAMMSDEDLFGSDDDDVFRNIDDDFMHGDAGKGGEEEASFKIPNLSAFEAAKTPPAKKFQFKRQQLHTSTVESKSVENEEASTYLLSQQSPLLARAKKRNADALESSPDVSLRQEASSLIEPSSDDLSLVVASRNRDKKRKRRKLAREFLDTQADLSRVDGSDFGRDESDADEDRYEGSFVDDATQRVSGGEKAMYLRSVVSPANRPSRPPRKLRPITADIFSQAVEPDDDDDYEDDSFCVGSDEDVEFQSQPDALDLIEELDETCLARTTKVTTRRRRIANAMASSSDDESVLRSPEARATAAEEADVVSREARLQRQREMQQQFRRKMGEKSKTEMEASNIHEHAAMKSLIPPDVKPSTTTRNEWKSPPVPTTAGSILVSSSEVHKVPELVSCLKHVHAISVQVRSFKGAGFLVSPRLAVDRRMLAEFCSGANRKAVVERCQLMNDLFERPCLLLESDRPSEDGVVPRSIHTPGHPRTKYVDALMAQLSQSKIQVLYTETQEESAAVIASLLRRERRRGLELPAAPAAAVGRVPDGGGDDRLLPFLQSLPGVGLGTALLMAARFTSLKGLVSCSPATLVSRTGLDEARARKICEYLRKTFAPDMTGL